MLCARRESCRWPRRPRGVRSIPRPHGPESAKTSKRGPIGHRLALMALDTRAMLAGPIRPGEHRGVVAPNRGRKAVIPVGVGGENLGGDISIARAHGVADLIDIATKIDDSLDIQVGSHVVARGGDDD